MRAANPPAQLSIAQLRVRDVLLDWDPLGLRERSETTPVDEYDDLIDPILHALAYEPDGVELADDLRSVLQTDYGVSVSSASCRNVAGILIGRLGHTVAVA